MPTGQRRPTRRGPPVEPRRRRGKKTDEDAIAAPMPRSSSPGPFAARRFRAPTRCYHASRSAIPAASGYRDVNMDWECKRAGGFRATLTLGNIGDLLCRFAEDCRQADGFNADRRARSLPMVEPRRTPPRLERQQLAIGDWQENAEHSRPAIGGKPLHRCRLRPYGLQERDLLPSSEPGRSKVLRFDRRDRGLAQCPMSFPMIPSSMRRVPRSAEFATARYARPNFGASQTVTYR